jgi:hypothetical protein
MLLFASLLALFLSPARQAWSAPFPMFAATDSGLYRRGAEDSAFERIPFDSFSVYGVAHCGRHVVLVGDSSYPMVSHDGGSTWHRASAKFFNYAPVTLTAFSMDSLFFVGSQDGVLHFISRDFGETWEGLGVWNFGFLGSVWFNEDVEYVNVSFDRGSTWQALPQRNKALIDPSGFARVAGEIWAGDANGIEAWSLVSKTWRRVVSFEGARST